MKLTSEDIAEHTLEACLVDLSMALKYVYLLHRYSLLNLHFKMQVASIQYQVSISTYLSGFNNSTVLIQQLANDSSTHTSFFERLQTIKSKSKIKNLA